MPKVNLIWLEDPGLEGLEGAAVARQAGLTLDNGGDLEAAVVCRPQAAVPEALRRRLAGRPVQWLDLAAEVGGGRDEHRLHRAVTAVARAAGRAGRGTLPQVYGAKAALNLLVAGAGTSALAAVKEAMALGHPVVWATPYRELSAYGQEDDAQLTDRLASSLPDNLEVLTETELINLSGGGGDFRALLGGPSGQREYRCGGVVLAPPGRFAPIDVAATLDMSWATLLSQANPEEVSGQPDKWMQIALLADGGNPMPAADFDRALGIALKLQRRPYTQVNFFFCEARVAGSGGERRYREARDAGVLFLRLGTGDLSIKEGGRLLSWHDSLLEEDIELAPDLLLAGETITADQPSFMDNQVLWPTWPWLVPEGPRYKGGRTSRNGLYVLGSLRGTPPGPERLAEAAAALADMHDRLSGGGPGGPMPLPAVNQDYCAICLTCVRVCPHGVPRHVEGHIEGAPAACLACGICAAECPAEAITPPGWSNPELEAGLQRGLQAAGEGALVLFACSQSAFPAQAELSRQGHEWPRGLLTLPVVCAGRVGQQLILRALTLGARGVLVAGCHAGNCRSVNGNLRASLRARETRELLAQLELDPERVRFMNMASNQPRALARAVADMAQALSGI